MAISGCLLFKTWNSESDDPSSVENGEAGYPHRELKSLLNIRVQNTINDLLKAGEIGRGMIDGISLYFNSRPEIAQKQLGQRQMGSDVKLDPYLIIRVLLHNRKPRPQGGVCFKGSTVLYGVSY